MKTIEGQLLAGDLTFGIAVSRFNDLITGKLLEGAIDALKRHGAAEENIEITRVPGAFELPLIAQKMARSGKYSGIICLGALIRGDTPHFDYVASEATKGIAGVSLKENLPVTFGLITAENIEQALERAGTKAGNKGFEAAVTTIEMADLIRKF